jgi:hypothetical protein
VNTKPEVAAGGSARTPGWFSVVKLMVDLRVSIALPSEQWVAFKHRALWGDANAVQRDGGRKTARSEGAIGISQHGYNVVSD